MATKHKDKKIGIGEIFTDTTTMESVVVTRVSLKGNEISAIYVKPAEEYKNSLVKEELANENDLIATGLNIWEHAYLF